MNHLRAVATLLMVQGVLEILAGIGALITAPGLAARRAGQVPADMILAFTVGLGILLFLCGGLKLVAGFQNRRLRGRTLGSCRAPLRYSNGLYRMVRTERSRDHDLRPRDLQPS